MQQRRRIYYSAAQRSGIWDRWQAGESMKSIGHRFDRTPIPAQEAKMTTARRLHRADRSELIWLPEHVNAFMQVAPIEMQRALILALHTGQRQGDLLRLAWGNYDGASITLRQGKTGARVDIPLHEGIAAHTGRNRERRRSRPDNEDAAPVDSSLFQVAMGGRIKGRWHRPAALP